MMRIGVLAVQGAFAEHEKTLRALGADCVELRQKKDIAGIDGLVLPGGESTVQGLLLRQLDMFDELKGLISDGLPVLATCAGLILLAQKLDADETVHFGTLPVTVRRNAYGRQLGSFETRAAVGEIADFPLVFIRAPYITEHRGDVNVLSTVDGKVVGVEYKNQIGLAFHPEMTSDSRIHESFLRKVRERINK